MAQKKITDLQLIEAITEDVNLPGDDTIQTYRLTVAQLRDFILDTESVVREKIAVSERMPIGTVLSFAGSSLPDGYLFCDGSAISRTTYLNLYNVIGVTHGQGNNSTTFNLPDYRGRFLRGVDNGTGRDPNRLTRSAMATGGNTGQNVGSVQGHSFQTHTHVQDAHFHYITSTDAYVSGISGLLNAAGTTASRSSGFQKGSSAVAATNQDANSSGTNSEASVYETRPVNAYVNYIIKY